MRPRHAALLCCISLVCGDLALAQSANSSVPSTDAKTKKAVQAKPSKAAKVAQEDPAKSAPVAPEITAELQAIADQIHTGKLPCEMGQSVNLLRDAQEPGRFNLFYKHHVYRLSPVHSATGAVRLEDPAHGAVWIQLADKSMLMNSQLGQRMLDACQSPSQIQVAEAHKLAPPPNLLDPLPGKGLAQK